MLMTVCQVLSDKEEVDKFQKTSCEIMMSASMELRKWRGKQYCRSPNGFVRDGNERERESRRRGGGEWGHERRARKRTG